ncbi:sugar transporter [Paraphysoderma sedebokerense]|nr:sugar transporter [Paraphysoderma sedebokerense]
MEVYDSSRRNSLSASQLFTLTVALLGMQFTWSVELAYGTPYLLSLGLEKSRVSLVWLAGPLSGLLIQPIVGAFSDRCTSRFGRRRPFIVGGALIVVASLIAIAYARELGHSPSKEIPLSEDGKIRATSLSIFIAVVAFYVLDFSINAVQAAIRALILDIPPAEQQQTANAWASVMLNMGNILGYLTGFLDLQAIFNVAGNSSQMKLLCLVGTVVFILTIGVTCVFTKEKPIDRNQNRQSNQSRWYHTFVDILHAVKVLPQPIRDICHCQFFAWMGWFPFLFYCSTWVAEYVAGSHTPFETPLADKAARAGSFAFLLFSIVSFVTSALLPLLSQPSNYSCRFTLTVPQIYTISQFLFFLIMWSSMFIYGPLEATSLVAVTGVLWSVAIWAPLSLIGEYIAVNLNLNVDPLSSENQASVETQCNGDTEELLEATDNRLGHPQRLSAGTILGIHNVYVVLPQFVCSLLAAVLFAILRDNDADHKGIVPGGWDDSIGWILRIGGVSAFVAGIYSFRVKQVQLSDGPVHIRANIMVGGH